MFPLHWWVRRFAIGAGCVVVGAVWVPGVADAAAGRQWAVVSATGALVRGHGATAASRIGAGVYKVTFSSDMTACAYEATSGDAATVPVAAPVQTVVLPFGSGAPSAVLVKMFDETTGSVADAPFHVTTYCDSKVSYAVVAANGTMDRGSHVTATSRIALGSYSVRFDHNVSRCAFTVTSAVTAVPGPISVAGLFATDTGVFVHTLNRAGADFDTPFQLAVDCGTKRDIGVVKTNGSTARGAHVTSSSKVGLGKYEVIFDRDVSACAYTATIGVPTSGGQINDPVVITTAGRPGNADGVSLAVRDVTGVAKNEPFHLTVTC